MEELNVSKELIHKKLNEFINSNPKVRDDLIRFHRFCDKVKKLGFRFEIVSCITNEYVFSVFDIKENKYLISNAVTRTSEESFEITMSAINKKILKVS